MDNISKFFNFVLAYRLYAPLCIEENIIDNPNERSSHTIPTPRGGGVSIVITFLLVLVGLIVSHQLEATTGSILVAAGLGVAVLGFLMIMAISIQCFD